MSPSGRGQCSTASTASNSHQTNEKNGKKNVKKSEKNEKKNNKSDETVDETSSNSEFLKHYEEKLRMLEAGFNAKLEALYKVIDQKDEMMGKLNREIGELKQSYNYLSQETADLKKSQEEFSGYIENQFDNTKKAMVEMKSKTIDLEDRSRRSNLVFYNVAEVANGVNEDCEQNIVNLLDSLHIFPPGDNEVWIDRAHRLGQKSPENGTRPRPIIVKFTYFKQKNLIIASGNKFRHSHVNVSEDFSRETLGIHKELHYHGKQAKEAFNDPIKSLVHYKVSYKRLVVTYRANKSDSNSRTFVKNFNLNYIQKNPGWFMPQMQRLDTDGDSV